MIRGVLNWFNELFHRPIRVFWICVGLGAIGVVLDGTAIRLWSLHREHDMIETRISSAKVRSRALEYKIHEAQSPEFIERAARDQFDLVKEGDLVFVFSDDGTEVAENSTQSAN